MFINIQHSTFNIQRPSEHPTPNAQHRTPKDDSWILMLTSPFIVPTRVKLTWKLSMNRSFSPGGASVPASRSSSNHSSYGSRGRSPLLAWFMVPMRVKIDVESFRVFRPFRGSYFPSVYSVVSHVVGFVVSGS